MTYTTDQTYQKRHGGYRNLRSYQTTTIIYDLQANYLLDRQLESLKKAFVEEGGFKNLFSSSQDLATASCLTENLFKARLEKKRER